MCELHVTERKGLSWGVLSGSGGRTELPLPRRRDERRDKVLVPVWRGFGGICRNQANESMLWDVVDSFRRKGKFRLCFCGPPGSHFPET